MNRLAQNELLYIRAMGKALAVTGLFSSDEDANAWLERHPDHGVVAAFEGRIYTAHLYDSGEPLLNGPHPRARLSRKSN